MTHTNAGAQPVPVPRYRARWYASYGQWHVDPLRLKVYGISWRTTEPGLDGPVPTELMSAAQRYVHEQLPAAAEREGHHGLGFVVVHEGVQGAWVLADWWAHNDICCQLLAHTAWPINAEFSPTNRPLLACVWETVVLAAERDAWVDTMLTDTPRPLAYLDRRLPDGRY